MSSHSKKRKRTSVTFQQSDAVDTSKPTSVFQVSGKGRAGTLSIALPGSILANAPGLDLKTVLAGRIARAAAVFCVDEIVIFDDGHSEQSNGSSNGSKRSKPDHDAGGRNAAARRDPNALLELLLSYAECPPHLRKALFEYHADLGKSGLLPSLDVPHHLKADEWCRYREAVAVGPALADTAANGLAVHSKSQRQDQHTASGSTIVDAGFPVLVPAPIPPHTRLTLKFNDTHRPATWPPPSHDASVLASAQPNLTAQAVDPAAPREEAGYYWGYSVRRAAALSAVWTECPFADGYDVSIGTSERGRASLQELLRARLVADARVDARGADPEAEAEAEAEAQVELKAEAEMLPASAAHVVLVVGGVAGLEVAVDADAALADKGITRANVGELFDHYVNVCPGQGSRTIRTEEALWIALAQLRSWTISAL